MRIKKAEYIDGYNIKLLFNNGILKIVDFSQFLSNTRKLLIPLSDINYFKSFYLDEITINWPNGLDFSPDVLYEAGKEFKGNTKKRPSGPRVKVSSSTIKSRTRISSKSKI